MLTDKFLDIVKSKVGCGYVWGSQGQMLAKDTLTYFIRTFGKEHYYFKNYSAEKWIGKQVFDCSGLVIYTLQTLGLISTKTDYNADMLYNSHVIKLKKEELKPCDLVFYDKNGYKSHIGVYIGNGEVVHAKGTYAGVVHEKMNSNFTHFGRLILLKDRDPNPPSKDEKTIKTLTGIAFNSPDYWIKAFETNTFKPEYVKQAFYNMAEYINKKG